MRRLKYVEPPPQDAPTDTRVSVAQDRYVAAAKALLCKAAAARTDPVEFFNFVMRDEHSHRRIVASAHQVVMIRFVEAHQRCAVRMPPNFAKSFTLDALALYKLGQDPTRRGAFISGAAPQAEKNLALVQSYLEQPDEFPELRLVFPALRPSPEPRDAWSRGRITVARPKGIRDASLAAFGAGAKSLLGSRISWAFVDDLLNRENTRTKDQRDEVMRWFSTVVLSRRDAANWQICVTNTAFCEDDLIDRLKAVGWPTLEMDAEGKVTISNTDWDDDGIRPALDWTEEVNTYRLTAHDPDELEQVPLWPERFPVERLAEERRDNDEYPLLYLNQTAKDGAVLARPEWFKACMQAAVDEGVHGLLDDYPGPHPVFVGVDLAFSKREKGKVARNAIFAFIALPDGRRQIVHIDYDSPSSRWSWLELVGRIGAVVARFSPLEVRVENNGAQDRLLEVALEVDASLPLIAHTTGANKVDPTYGVASLLTELQRGAWLIPCAPGGRLDPRVAEWVAQVKAYRPNQHTGDVLMACWFAREGARKAGLLSTSQAVKERLAKRFEQSIAMAMLQR